MYNDKGRTFDRKCQTQCQRIFILFIHFIFKSFHSTNCRQWSNEIVWIVKKYHFIEGLDGRKSRRKIFHHFRFVLLLSILFFYYFHGVVGVVTMCPCSCLLGLRARNGKKNQYQNSPVVFGMKVVPTTGTVTR